MSCGCTKNNRTVVTTSNPSAQPVKTGEVLVKAKKEVSPTDQCASCLYKHYLEAYCLLTEYTYLDANRRLVIGNLRAMVLHSFKDWKEVADLSRECALLLQRVKDKEALEKMERLGDMVEKIYYESDPEAKNRLETLKMEHKNDQ